MFLLRKGFSILELLTALTLLSSTAAFAISAFFARPEITLEKASILLARDLRAAQNRSAYMAEGCRFVFSSDGDGYEVRDMSGKVISNPRTDHSFERAYSSDGVFDGVQITHVDAGGDRVLVYDDLGRATEGVRIRIEFSGSQRELVLERGSGKVRIIGSTSDWVDRGY